MPSPDPRHGATRFSHHHLVRAGAEDGRLVFADRCSMDVSFYAIVWQGTPNPFPAAALSMGHPPPHSCPSDHGFPGCSGPGAITHTTPASHQAAITARSSASCRRRPPAVPAASVTTTRVNSTERGPVHGNFHHGPLGIPGRRHTWATAADPGLTDTRLENEFGYVPASVHDMLRPFPRSPTTPTPSRGPFLSCAHALGSAITQPRPHV